MKTRVQRRNFISRWYILWILLVGSSIAAVGMWAMGENRMVLAKVAAQHAIPDANLPVQVNENSLKITFPVHIKDSVKRPLWSMTRQPYVPPAPPKPLPPPVPEPPPPEPPKEIPSFEGVLSSVILTEQLQIVFVNTAEGIIRLEPGMAYNEWVLANINEDSAEFHYDDEKKVLQLRSFATANATPAKLLGGGESHHNATKANPLEFKKSQD